MDSNGNSSRIIAQEQSLSLSSRPDLKTIKPPVGTRIPAGMKVEKDRPAEYDFGGRDSTDGVTHCLLESDEGSDESSGASKEMIDQSA